MGRTEQYSLLSLAALGIVYWWFQMRMLDDWKIVDQPASALFWVYLVVITASTVLEIVIASFLAVSWRGKTAAKDERDHAIDAKASQVERVVIIAAVNVLIWQALMEGVFAHHSLPRIDLTQLPTLFFFLFTILFGGEVVKRVATLVLYRAQASRG